MSKYVKNLIADELKGRLDGVSDAIIANVIGMDSAKTYEIRKLLREKGVNMLVVKRSLAGRATTDTSLNSLFAGKQGSMAVIWGCEDFVSLCKEITARRQEQSVRQVRTEGWRDGWRVALCRTSPGDQQVAQSSRTDLAAGRTDPQPRCQSVGTAARPWCQAGWPSQEVG